MATLSNISYFTTAIEDHTKFGGSQTTATDLTIAGTVFDNTYTLAGGSGSAGTAITCWSTSIFPADADYIWCIADSDDIQIELSLGTTDAIYFQLKSGVPFVLGRDDVLLRAAYNSTPFNSPGSSAVVTRIAARNSATATTTTGNLRVVVAS